MTDHIARIRAFRHYHDSGNAGASQVALDAMALLDDYDALAARLAEAERDAARYRWLRDTETLGYGVCIFTPDEANDGTGFWRVLFPDETDAIVDSAMRRAGSATVEQKP